MYFAQVLLLLLYVPILATATDLVQIAGEFNSSTFANIEAKQLGIIWDSKTSNLPSEASDFLTSRRRSLWRSVLDGPADANEQILAVCDVGMYMLYIHQDCNGEGLRA